MKKIITLLVFTISIFICNAQEIVNYYTVDYKTSTMFQDQDWDNLIKEVNKANKLGIDYYNLKYRYAIANFNTKKYFRALSDFEKLYKSTPWDNVLAEYLYYSYIFTGRFEEASFFLSKLNDEMKTYLAYSKPKIISAFGGDYKIEIIPKYQQKKRPNEELVQTSMNSQDYYGINLENKIGNRIKLYHAYSNVKIENTVQSAFGSGLPGISTETGSQNLYYLSLNYRLNTSTDFTVAVHYLNTKLLNTVPDLRDRSKKITLYDLNMTGFVGVAGIGKWIGCTKNQLSVSLSNFNSVNDFSKSFQIQPEYKIRIHPLNNPVFYSESGIRAVVEAGTQPGVSPVFLQSFGLSFAKYFFIEASASIGKMANFTENMGMIANNDADKIKQRFSALLNVSLIKSKLNLYFMYQYKIKENEYIRANTYYYQEYVNQSLIGGLKFYL